MPRRRALLAVCILTVLFARFLCADALEPLAKKAPLLARALRSDATICGLLVKEEGQRALRRVLDLARSRDPDVQKGMEIICRPVPKTEKKTAIHVDGDAEDWAGIEAAEIPEPSAFVCERDAALGLFKAYADGETLYLLVRTERAGFLSTGGNDVGFDIDLIDHPALDWRITVKGGTLAVMQQAQPVQESHARNIGDQTTIRYGNVLEISLPLALLSGGQEVKPIISVRAFTVVKGKGRARHTSNYAFVACPGARPEHYCLPYARSLFYLCLDCDVGRDDLTALALAISRAIYWYVGDGDVRKQARKDTADVYRIARDIVAWQKARGLKTTLADYPLEAQLTWAMQGAERVGVRYFPIFRPGKRPTLEEYQWISLRPENLRRLRKMAEENKLVDADLSVTAEKIDKWARSVQHYRVKLEEMKRRCDRGILKKETYEEAAEEAKKGIDKWLKLGGRDVFYGTMNSANAVLKLYEKTGNFYGNCSDHTLLCTAMYSALGIAPQRYFREPSRQKAVNHVWPGYYDPAARRWQSPQKGKTKSHSCVYFKFGWYPVYLDSYCLPRGRLRPNDKDALHRYGVQEVTRQHLTAVLTRGFDAAQVRDYLLTPCRRMRLPKVAPPEVLTVSPDESAIRVGIFAGEKASQRSVRKTIEALSSVSDIDAIWFLASDVNEKLCKGVDVFLFPGGSSRQAEIIGKAGCERIRGAVQKGKGYVGICAGGYMAAISWNWCKPIRMVAARTDTKYWNRGTGTAVLDTVGPHDPLWLFYTNGPVFSPIAFGGLGVPVPLANYVSEFRKNKAPEGTMRGRGAIIASTFGKGRVALFGPHPDLTPGMEHLLVRAVRWAGSKEKRGKEIHWEKVFGRDAAPPREIRPCLHMKRGNQEEWHGVVVGAPRATSDWHTGDVALALTERHGAPSVCAYGMQSMYVGHAFDVSWPSERIYSYWRMSEQRTYTADARRVYDAYQKALFDVGGAHGAPLNLYVELRGHSLRAGEKSKKPVYRQVVEACAVGFSEKEVQRLKQVYGRLMDKISPKIKAPIYFSNLPDDRTYEVEGRKVEFEYSTRDLEETGAMRPARAKRALLLALPRGARFEGGERRKYVDVIGGLLVEAGKMARDAPANRSEGNLLRNGGMERDIAADWLKRTPHDEKRKLSRTDEVAHRGKWSLQIANTSDVHSRWRQGSDGSIGVKPGTALALTGWVRSSIRGNGRALLTLLTLSEGNRILSVVSTRPVRGKSDWTLCRQEIDVPPAATHCAVYLELRGKGQAWFDDVALEARPDARKKKRDIVLATDLPEDDPMRRSIRALCPGRVETVAPAKLSSHLAGKAFALVLLRAGVKGSGLVYSALKDFARRGGTVVMDLGSYGESSKLKVDRRRFAGLPQAQAVFAGRGGAHRVYVYCADDVRSDGTIYLEAGGRVAGRWRLDAARRIKGEETVARVFVTTPVKIKKGDTIRLAASPAGGECCAVDRLEIVPTRGKAVVIQAEDMKVSGYSVGTNIASLGKGIKTKRSAIGERVLRIETENDVTRGFHAGDRVPWFGGEFDQGLSPKVMKGVRVLAKSESGGAKLIEENMGKGRIIAMDLLGVDEPALGRPGAYNKYVFLSNVVGRGVRWGEFVPKKLSYAGFVGKMKTLAETYQGITLKEEGPASGGFRIYSLNIGDTSRPTFFIYAVTHGAEWEPGYGLLSLAKRIAASPSACGLDLDRYAFKFIPILNPWGYEKRSRKNANGVDINRNSSYCWESYTRKEPGKGADAYDDSSWKWKGPAPFSEAEAQTYRKIVDTGNIQCLIDVHCTAHFLGLPTTSGPENDAKAAALRRIFRRNFAGRYVAEVPVVPGIVQYRLGPMMWMGETPCLLQYSAKDRYGVLLELPGCYSATYGTVMQTDIVATACMAAIEAYGGLRAE
ncbi:MAG: hypothetical protein GXP25_22075 [Planctomycetes bacterium]|nr:hypothetical protein [Planctomycetota bacterium]